MAKLKAAAAVNEIKAEKKCLSPSKIIKYIKIKIIMAK